MNADDETNITDIELLPDGRIYVFGTSLEVLEVLDKLQGGQDPAVNLRRQSHQDHSLRRHTSKQIEENYG